MLPMVARKTKPSGRLWCPAADVYETREGWLVKVELAGVSIEDVEIDLQGNSLYIAGTRRDGHCSGDGVTFHQMEITYSRFEKTLKFPRSIDGAKLEYDYKDGLLIVHLRSSKAEGKTVQGGV
ncbi:MAG TPA: Hsp20/alpha crystallin family protein [Pyrinomonadaceae bacterium]|nr:Hsp20/alpha crystallin family protein [Pyrinomonadaceae bacterium]